MSETEETPKEPEEPDTPIEVLKVEYSMVAEVAAKAQELVAVRARREELGAREELLTAELLPLMRACELHGIRLPDGTAVRRRWNPNRPVIDPVKLAAKCADYAEFTTSKVVVDQARLRDTYPELWREMGGHLVEGVAVYGPRKKKAA